MKNIMLKPLLVCMLLDRICLLGGAQNNSCVLYCEKDAITSQVCCKQYPLTSIQTQDQVNTTDLVFKLNSQTKLIADLRKELEQLKKNVTKLENASKCNNTTLCKHGNCVNQPGDYFCICHYGYPGTDRRSCVLPRSCQEIFDKENMASGTYDISPDGVNTLTVKCNMNFQGNKKMTEVGHNLPNATKADKKCENSKCWSRKITYHGNFEGITSLVDRSVGCQQFMKYQCHHATMTWPIVDGSSTRIMQVPWTDRNGNDVYSYAGAKKNNSCPCFDKGNCETSSSYTNTRCNCDSNDKTWREDSGYVRNRTQLPVTIVYASDLANKSEEVHYTLGSLQCWG